MTQAEMEHKLDSCKTTDEAAVLMREYYDCPESHTKVKTWVYLPLPEAKPIKFDPIEPVQLQYQSYYDIACLDCKMKKNAAYE